MNESKATPVTLHGRKYWKVGNDVYVKVGGNLAKVDHFDANNNPVIKTWSEETPNAAGGQDCTVHVECLKIAGKPQKPE